MTALSNAAEPAVQQLLESNEEQLLEQLGLRANALKTAPELAGQFDPLVTYDGSDMGAIDTLRDLGARIYHRWEKETFAIICGNAADDESDRENLATAFEFGGTAVAGIIAAQLVTSFGLAPAIAAVIAAIVIKRYLRPAYDEFCVVWGERIGCDAAAR